MDDKDMNAAMESAERTADTAMGLASALIEQIKSASNASAAAQLMQQLHGLILPANNPFAAEANKMIANSIASAQRAVAEKEADEIITNSVIPAESAALTQSTYHHMSADEKAYFDSFKPGSKYSVVSVSEDGRIIAGSEQQVDGAVLQQDFANVVRFARDEDTRKHIAAEAGTSQLCSSDQEPSKAAQQECAELHESLTRLEGAEAAKHRDRPEHIRRNRERFKEAHERIEKVEMHCDAFLEANDEKTRANAAAMYRATRREASQYMQDHIIDETLLGKPPAASRVQAVDADELQAPPLPATAKSRAHHEERIAR